jgi:hypothetical protein
MLLQKPPEKQTGPLSSNLPPQGKTARPKEEPEKRTLMNELLAQGGSPNDIHLKELYCGTIGVNPINTQQ